MAAVAGGRGWRPWLTAMAVNHGCQQPLFLGGHFFRRPNSTFPRFRRISSNETSKIRFSRRSHRVPFFFRPKRTLRGPGRAKNVFFSQTLAIALFTGEKHIFENLCFGPFLGGHFRSPSTTFSYILRISSIETSKL